MSRSTPLTSFLTLTTCVAAVVLSCAGCGQRVAAPVTPAPVPIAAGAATYPPSEQQAHKQAWAQSQEAFMKAQLQSRPGGK